MFFLLPTTHTPTTHAHTQTTDTAQTGLGAASLAPGPAQQVFRRLGWHRTAVSPRSFLSVAASAALTPTSQRRGGAHEVSREGDRRVAPGRAQARGRHHVAHGRFRRGSGRCILQEHFYERQSKVIAQRHPQVCIFEHIAELNGDLVLSESNADTEQTAGAPEVLEEMGVVSQPISTECISKGNGELDRTVDVLVPSIKGEIVEVISSNPQEFSDVSVPHVVKETTVSPSIQERRKKTSRRTPR